MLLPNVDVVSLLDELVASLVEFGQFRQQRVHMLLNDLELITSFNTIHIQGCGLTIYHMHANSMVISLKMTFCCVK